MKQAILNIGFVDFGHDDIERFPDWSRQLTGLVFEPLKHTPSD